MYLFCPDNKTVPTAEQHVDIPSLTLKPRKQLIRSRKFIVNPDLEPKETPHSRSISAPSLTIVLPRVTEEIPGNDHSCDRLRNESDVGSLNVPRQKSRDICKGKPFINTEFPFAIYVDNNMKKDEVTMKQKGVLPQVDGRSYHGDRNENNANRTIEKTISNSKNDLSSTNLPTLSQRQFSSNSDNTEMRKKNTDMRRGQSLPNIASACGAFEIIDKEVSPLHSIESLPKRRPTKSNAKQTVTKHRRSKSTDRTAEAVATDQETKILASILSTKRQSSKHSKKKVNFEIQQHKSANKADYNWLDWSVYKTEGQLNNERSLSPSSLAARKGSARNTTRGEFNTDCELSSDDSNSKTSDSETASPEDNSEKMCIRTTRSMDNSKNFETKQPAVDIISQIPKNTIIVSKLRISRYLDKGNTLSLNKNIDGELASNESKTMEHKSRSYLTEQRPSDVASLQKSIDTDNKTNDDRIGNQQTHSDVLTGFFTSHKKSLRPKYQYNKKNKDNSNSNARCDATGESEDKPTFPSSPKSHSLSVRHAIHGLRRTYTKLDKIETRFTKNNTHAKQHAKNSDKSDPRRTVQSKTTKTSKVDLNSVSKAKQTNHIEKKSKQNSDHIHENKDEALHHDDEGDVAFVRDEEPTLKEYNPDFNTVHDDNKPSRKRGMFGFEDYTKFQHSKFERDNSGLARKNSILGKDNSFLLSTIGPVRLDRDAETVNKLRKVKIAEEVSKT
ncbi:unnamed protein product [Owenia fusiformis]|uniref:Uncharacterized protein n=1 Tax=Owenia fusiformis TaxID=6347 RepID=A0A8S4N1J1_OWEFU|nr:unnamed protein product [Owenia fusiformis]